MFGRNGERLRELHRAGRRVTCELLSHQRSGQTGDRAPVRLICSDLPKGSEPAFSADEPYDLTACQRDFVHQVLVVTTVTQGVVSLFDGVHRWVGNAQQALAGI